MADDGQDTGGAEHYEYGGPMADMENFPVAVGSPMMHFAAKAADTKYQQAQFDKLRDDQEMRRNAPVSDQHYLGRSHDDLHSMVNDDLDTDTANTAGEIAAELGNWLSDVSTKMRNAIKQQQVEWQGEAADKAHGLFKANSDWSDGTSDAAWLVSNRYKEQADSAADARNNMPEPTGFDQDKEMDKAVKQIAGGNFGAASDTLEDMPKKQHEAEEKHAEAAQVMHKMDQGYYETAKSQPAFSKPPDPADSGSSSTSAAGYVSGDSGGGTGPGNSSGPSPGGGSGNGGSGPGSPGGSSSSVSSAPNPGGRSYSGAAPIGSASHNGAGGTNAPSPGNAGRSTPGGVAGAPVAGGGNLRDVGSDKPRAGLSRGGAGGSGSPRSGSSSAAPRATGGNSASGGERSAAGRATGSEPGGSKGAVPRGGAAAAKAAESSSGGGRPMAGAPGAGRGGGGGDEEEHQRKYEFGEDPDEIFGEEAEYTEDGHRVVPPVIGG